MSNSVYDHTLYNELKQFISICRQYKELYVYGEAFDQQILAKYLDECGLPFRGFITTATIKNVEIHPDAGVFLGLPEKYYNDVLPILAEQGINNIITLNEYAKKCIVDKLAPRRPEDTIIEVNLADHCNLNCQMCDHFSQIAKAKFIDIVEFERDISRLAELTERHLGFLYLLGGEPLLNPQIASLCKVARAHLPDTSIQIFTNGLLLLDESMQEFYAACREYDISIEVTHYPIRLNYDAIKEKARLENVKLNFFIYASDKEVKGEKLSVKSPLNSADADEVWAVVECYQMNKCAVLRNGRLYMCPLSAYIHHFNGYFGKNFKIDSSDSLDIHQAEGFTVLSEFLSRPVPFCRYCQIGKRELFPWKPSNREINEYI